MTSDAQVTPAQEDRSGDQLARLRAGDDTAFAELFAQHAPAVRRLARGLAGDAAHAEDIVAETFFRVLQAVRRGSGPRESVRAYLLTVARRVAWEWQGAARDVPVSDDELDTRAGCAEHNAVRAADCSLIASAFSSLPERWRSVLWWTEVEGEQASVVAPHFGLSANAAAALARRARQGLRAAYLQAHLVSTTCAAECRAVRGKLGRYLVHNLTRPEARRISAHLEVCVTCRDTHDELRDVCFSLRAHAGDIAVLIPLSAAAGTGGGLFAALKTALTGAKVKVAAAVASTAAAGVFGFAVGPGLSDLATLELNGQQGAPEPTLVRPSPADGTALPEDALTDEPSRAPETEARRTPDAQQAPPPRVPRPAAEADPLPVAIPKAPETGQQVGRSKKRAGPRHNDPASKERPGRDPELVRSAAPVAAEPPAPAPVESAPAERSGKKTPPGHAKW